VSAVGVAAATPGTDPASVTRKIDVVVVDASVTPKIDVLAVFKYATANMLEVFAEGNSFEGTATVKRIVT